MTHEELRELYDAVVYSVGAQTDRQLGIPGEDLPGSWAATEFVAWYNGHPDFQELEFDLSHERAVVIGNGNVALDVARMLALTPEELAPTDTTDAAIDAINGAGVEEILVVGRRGPVQAAWTPVEVGELGELAGADIVVDPVELELDPASAAELEAAPRRSSGTSTISATTPHAVRPASRAGSGCVSSPRRSRSSATARSRRSSSSATSSSTAAPSRPKPGTPSPAGSSSAASATAASHWRESLRRGLGDDSERGRPDRAGALRRRLDQARPSGVIGTNKKDATETVALLLEDARRRPPRGGGTLEELLAERGVEAVLYAGWEAIDVAERSAGEPHGPRIKLASWDALLDASRASNESAARGEGTTSARAD